VTRHGAFQGSALDIFAGGRLTIEDLIWDGAHVASSYAIMNINGGELTMNSGLITNNDAANFGGGVYLTLNAANVFNMNGGSIKGNSAGIYGDDVYFYRGTINLTGSPQIGGAYGGVWMNSDAVFTLTSDLASTAKIYIEDKSGAAAGTTIAQKTGGASVSASEAHRFIWTPSGLRVVHDDTQQSYILEATNDLYVATWGTDGAPGNGTLANPYRTIPYACTQAIAGAPLRVIVMDSMDMSSLATITTNKNITLTRWDDAEEAVVTVTRANLPGLYTGSLFLVNANASLKVEDLTIAGGGLRAHR
jgi:hypothetical protein